MEYKGKLYGKVNGVTFPLLNTTDDWDKMEARIKELEDSLKQTKIKMKFKDAPTGARFKHPESNKVWVKINSYSKGQFNDGNGLICSWNGNVEGHQLFCSFVDKELGIDFDTEVELV